MPAGMEPGLEATSFFDPSNFTFPFGTHIAVVEVDVDTGLTTLRRYVAVDDVGNVINPMIVDGQLHGGIAQGVAQALWEWASYDEAGELTTGSLMGYCLPRAHQLPRLETRPAGAPPPVKPPRGQGGGGGGAVAAPPAGADARS